MSLKSIYKTAFGFHIDLSHIQMLSDLEFTNENNDTFRATFNIQLILQNDKVYHSIPLYISTRYIPPPTDHAGRYSRFATGGHEAPTKEQIAAVMKEPITNHKELLEAWQNFKKDSRKTLT